MQPWIGLVLCQWYQGRLINNPLCFSPLNVWPCQPLVNVCHKLFKLRRTHQPTLHQVGFKRNSTQISTTMCKFWEKKCAPLTRIWTSDFRLIVSMSYQLSYWGSLILELLQYLHSNHFEGLSPLLVSLKLHFSSICEWNEWKTSWWPLAGR